MFVSLRSGPANNRLAKRVVKKNIYKKKALNELERRKLVVFLENDSGFLVPAKPILI